MANDWRTIGIAAIMLAATLAWSIYTWLLRRRRPPLPLGSRRTRP